MKKPSPYQIEAFANAAREKSFSTAAQILGVSQSSVTQHVANLEKIIGAQLFIRRREGLELTRAGRELFDIADRWIDINTQVLERVSDYSALEDGFLKIIATAPRPALPLIAEYARRYPKVQIEFKLLNWTQNTEAIRERSVDLSIMAEPDLNPAIHARKVETVGYRAVMRIDHALAKKRSVSLSQLLDHPIIMTEDGSFTQRVFQSAARKMGTQIKPSVKMTTFAVVKEAILHGLGVGILLDNSVSETQRLVSIPIKEMPETYSNYLVVPSEKQDLRLVKRFLEMV